MEGIVTPQTYLNVQMKLQAAEAVQRRIPAGQLLWRGRTDIIMPAPALAISSKKTQATFAVLPSRSVGGPKPLAGRAKAAVWRGQYAPNSLSSVLARTVKTSVPMAKGKK